MAILLSGKGEAQAQEAAVVWIAPQTLSLDQGQVGSVAVRIESAANLYGVQIELLFDGGKVKILDADQTKEGVQVLGGDLLALDQAFMAENEVNNEIGGLTYALTLLAPAEAASGSGTLLEFEVEALEQGVSELLLDTVILASPEGQQLEVLLPRDRGVQASPTATVIKLPTSLPTTAPSAIATVKVEPSSTPQLTAESPAAAPSATVFVPSATAVLASPTGEMAPEESSPVDEATPLPTATEKPDLASAVERTTTAAAPIQTPEAESEPANGESAAEIAAAPQAIEEAESISAAEVPSPALTVVGQNSSLDELQTPAPASEDSGEGIEGSVIAIGLLVVIAALVSLLYWRRSKAKT